MSLEPGTRVGPYEILELLASSGMGEVYRARDRRLGRDVALKKLPAGARTDPARIEGFETEARAASALNHPNILAVYDVGVHDGAPFVVSEMLEGQTLRDRLASGPLSARKAVDHARQLARGLAAAHDRGIVHRDLKPENLFLTRDGYLKILDFGLARLITDEGPVPQDDAATQGRVMGTVGYMAPEQVRGESADPRADIFAFGAVLHEMLSGRRAFQAGTSVETLNAILKEEPAPLPAEIQGSNLERLVWHCLEKAPEDRFQSARDLAFDLDGSSSASIPGVPTARRARGRTLASTLGGFALGALAAGVAARLLLTAPAPAPVYERLSFRRGTIEAARFASDGQTVVYGAAWGGDSVEIFAGRLGSPESRPLGLVETELLSVSSRGELLLCRARRRVGTFVGSGTLARVALAGGAPRDVQEDVQWADWAPDGRSLAIVRSVAGKNRLEFPIGRVLHETAGWISHPRFVPKGDAIAFLDHPVWGDDGGHVALVDLNGTLRSLSRNWGTLQGVAPSRDGREILFAGSRVGGARAVHGVDFDGRERIVVRMPGVLTIHDVNAEGRLLLSHHSQRRELVGRAPGEAGERELSWLDYSFASDISDDGSTVFFAENGEGGGPGYSVYVRRVDGSAAVRLGEGAAMALSPDGKLALANRDYTTDSPQLALIPTGVGEARLLPRGGVNTQAASFFPDGRRVLLAASAPGAATRVFLQSLDGGDPKPIAPEGTRFSLSTKPVSPDGTLALLQDEAGRHRLYPVGGGEARDVPGLAAEEQPLRFGADDRILFAYRPGQIPARVVRIDTRTGRREAWLELAPGDRSGVLAVNPVLLTPDGRGYVYGFRRVLSDLYSVSGLR